MVERVDSKITIKTKYGEVERCQVVLTNNKDWKVQVTIWGDNINRVIHNIQTPFVCFLTKLKSYFITNIYNKLIYKFIYEINLC